MNDAVRKWKARGHVHAWRYRTNTRNYPGWHLNANDEGGDSLLEVIDLMIGSNHTAEAVVPLTPPAPKQLQVPNAKSGWVAASALLLRYSPMKVSFDHWKLTETSGAMHLEVGRGNLSRLRDGVVDVLSHRGDYCIGNDGEELWFWWG